MLEQNRNRILESIRELLSIAERGATGEPNAIHDGYGIAEHEAYSRAMRDAISIIESGY